MAHHIKVWTWAIVIISRRRQGRIHHQLGSRSVLPLWASNQSRSRSRRSSWNPDGLQRGEPVEVKGESVIELQRELAGFASKTAWPSLFLCVPLIFDVEAEPINRDTLSDPVPNSEIRNPTANLRAIRFRLLCDL
jgi:hypothetical protein